MMRSLLLTTAFFLAMTLPACAESVNAEGAVASVKAEDTAERITILGHEIPAPVRVDQPVDWNVVRDHVPAALHETPKPPMAEWEVYNEVNRLMREKMKAYEAALDALAVERKGQYPEKTLEDIKLEMAEYFVTGSGEGISPEIQKLAFEYAALQYLQESFQARLEAQGYKPSFHAPGGVPPFVPEYPGVK